jgi:hypothetical protein
MVDTVAYTTIPASVQTLELNDLAHVCVLPMVARCIGIQSLKIHVGSLTRRQVMELVAITLGLKRLETLDFAGTFMNDHGITTILESLPIGVKNLYFSNSSLGEVSKVLFNSKRRRSQSAIQIHFGDGYVHSITMVGSSTGSRQRLVET